MKPETKELFFNLFMITLYVIIATITSGLADYCYPNLGNPSSDAAARCFIGVCWPIVLPGLTIDAGGKRIANWLRNKEQKAEKQ